MREPPGPCGAGRLRCAYAFVAECLCLRVGAGGRRPAREIATRELRSEWSISKPGQALPPPTGTAAGPPVSSTPVEPGVLMIGSACLLEARPGPAAARRHRGRALLWFLRHYANPSNNERPGPQPHKQTLNNVRTRPVVQCLPMGRCAYPRLGLLVWAVHPIRRHYTPSVRVHRHVTGAAPPSPTGTAARPRRPRGAPDRSGLSFVC